MNPLTCGSEALVQHNIHYVVDSYLVPSGHTKPLSFIGLGLPTIQALLRACRCMLRQNSYVCGPGLVNAFSFKWSSIWIGGSFDCGGLLASAKSSAPCVSSHSASSASALSSTHFSRTSRTALRWFAERFSFASMNDFKRCCEHSKRYWSGGGSDSDTADDLSAERARLYGF